MNLPSPSFPENVWTGLSRSRENPKDAAPDWIDWDRIVAELIAVQEFLFDGDIYSAVATETILKGQCSALSPSGLSLASNVDGLISGIAVTSALMDEQISYLRRGRVAMSDWMHITGTSTLSPGTNYFLGLNGQLTSIAPETGYLVQVGQAQSPITFDFEIGMNFKL